MIGHCGSSRRTVEMSALRILADITGAASYFRNAPKTVAQSVGAYSAFLAISRHYVSDAQKHIYNG